MRASNVLQKIAIYESGAETRYRSKTSLPGRYRKRTNDFVGRSWDLDLNTMTGHSYRWYKLVKKINGRVVLNSYRYSHSTSKHIGHVETILRAMNIKYIRVEAPRGLQDLSTALEYAMKQLSKCQLANQYSRTAHHPEGHWNRQIKLIKSLGGRTIVKQSFYDEFALRARESYLAYQKIKRQESKARKAVEQKPALVLVQS